jgi:hypothetical protein
MITGPGGQSRKCRGCAAFSGKICSEQEEFTGSEMFDDRAGRIE